MVPASLLKTSPSLFTLENLHRAWRRCLRRKRHTGSAMEFEQNLEENLIVLRDELIEGCYQPGLSRAFLVEKPKRREIFGAEFRDRVVHHLLVEHLEHGWERRFIDDSYACRKNKGTHGAVEKLRSMTRKVTDNGICPAFYLQLDIKGFFISIDRRILFQRLAVHETNPAVLDLVRTLVFHDPTQHCRLRDNSMADFMKLPEHKTLFKAQPWCGLPIGNLTSQFFANVYLDALDQYCKHQLKTRYYVRYCDDFVILSKDREQLREWQLKIEAFIWDQLRLCLNDKQKLRPVADGIDFLGYIVRPDYLLPRKRVVVALNERLIHSQRIMRSVGMVQFGDGRKVFPWNWPHLQQIRQWLTSYHGHIKRSSGHRLWCDIMQRFWWIDEYFVWRNGVPYFRYPPPRYYSNFYQQKKWFVEMFPDHVLMIRRGLCWEMAAKRRDLLPDPTWLGRRFFAHDFDSIRRLLWESGLPVAWIGETGRRVMNIAERTLINHWKGIHLGGP